MKYKCKELPAFIGLYRLTGSRICHGGFREPNKGLIKRTRGQ